MLPCTLCLATAPAPSSRSRVGAGLYGTALTGATGAGPHTHCSLWWRCVQEENPVAYYGLRWQSQNGTYKYIEYPSECAPVLGPYVWGHCHMAPTDTSSTRVSGWCPRPHEAALRPSTVCPFLPVVSQLMQTGLQHSI